MGEAEFDAAQERFLRGIGAVLNRSNEPKVSGSDDATQNTTSAENAKSDPWPVMHDDAYYGLVGEFVRAVAPYSEADPVALLMNLLVGCGCFIGPDPHMLVDHTRHPARLNNLQIGRTAGGRKGTAWGAPRLVFSIIDDAFITKRVKGGLSSGEGLIYHVRDAVMTKAPSGKTRRRPRLEDIQGDASPEMVIEDPGESDKRLLIFEPEFTAVLKIMEREGNTLSPVLRQAWDDGTLSPLTKNNRICATGAHICLIGHITPDELLRHLTATERANGFANRFLITLVRRSKFLPNGQGAPLSTLNNFAGRFKTVIERARIRGRLARDEEAADLWAQMYPKLEDEVGGMTGAILGRAAAQVLRLSLHYALLDEDELRQHETAVRTGHLLAALAVWEFCKKSVHQIFGDSLGDPIADRFLRAIKAGPQTDTDLYQLVGAREGDSLRKEVALDLLLRCRRVHFVKIKTAGRPVREWHAGSAPEDCPACRSRQA